MKIEEMIKNNKNAFESDSIPSGHQLRFAEKLEQQLEQKKRIRRLWIMLPSAVAAIMLLALLLPNVINFTNPVPVKGNNELVEMRRVYDERVSEAVERLESVLVNVDDSTRMEITNVINDLTNTSDIFAEMAPLPEEKQMAITSQIYDNQLETIHLITEKINK